MGCACWTKTTGRPRYTKFTLIINNTALAYTYLTFYGSSNSLLVTKV